VSFIASPPGGAREGRVQLVRPSLRHAPAGGVDTWTFDVAAGQNVVVLDDGHPASPSGAFIDTPADRLD
jgi:hypothetical protein